MEKILHNFNTQISHAIIWLRGHEETGCIPIDLISFDTRNNLQKAGCLN